MKTSMFLAMLAVMMTALPASADTPAIKPGLWQHQIKFQTESGELERQMEQVRQQLQQLPEAQRQMMANMMKSQGLDFNFEKQEFKTCLSKARAEEGQFSLSQNNDCRVTDRTEQDGNTVLSFSCSGKQNTGSGTVTFFSDEHYTGQSQTTTEINGKPEKMTIEHSGQWLGADCGSIKPY